MRKYAFIAEKLETIGGSVGGPDMATALQDTKVNDADRVATLVRIFRSATLASDQELASSAQDELAKLGICIIANHAKLARVSP